MAAAKFTKGGNVIAIDFARTGEEPNWKKKGIDISKERVRSLGFYSYYLDKEDLRKDLILYMKNHQYSNGDIEMISGSNLHGVTFTAMKMARSLNRGMPDDYGDSAMVEKEIHGEISDLVAKKIPVSRVSAGGGSPKKVSLETLVDKHVIYYLEEMVDGWVGETTRIKGLNLGDLIIAGKIPDKGKPLIGDWIDKNLAEYVGAISGDPDLAEGYSYLSKPAIKTRITILENLLATLKLKQPKVKGPRKVKPRDLNKVVAKLQFIQESEELGVKSINPLDLFNKGKIILFNTKNRQLSFYISDEKNTDIKGSSILNWHATSSYALTLRKPKEQIATILAASNSGLSTALDSIKTKKKSPNGKINKDTLILRAL